MKFLGNISWPITLISLLLLSIGVLVIYSSSAELAIQQIAFGVIGLWLYFFLSSFDYHSIRGLIMPLFILTIFLLTTVFFLGIETRGSIRWIPLGLFNVQPSEFAKPVLILFLASFWSRNRPSWKNILISLAWFSPMAYLVFKQPDLGSALTLGAIWLGLLIAARLSVKKLLILMLIAFFVLPVGWFSLREYQKMRVLSFLSPGSDPLGRGYNLIQSTIAVGSGEVFGRGLGRGTQSRLQFLPEFRTDFIFASIAEELGFVGSLIILLLYLGLLIYCLRLVNQTTDLYGSLLIYGVVSMMLFQTGVNIGMNIGLLPITGITLPLVSYGGSSLIATFMSLALVASVSKQRKKIDIDQYQR